MIKYDLNKAQEKLLRDVIKREAANKDTLLATHTVKILNEIIETKKYTEEQAELLNGIYQWYKL